MGHKVAYFNRNVLHNRNTFDTHFKYSIVNYFDKIDYNLDYKRVQFYNPNFNLNLVETMIIEDNECFFIDR